MMKKMLVLFSVVSFSFTQGMDLRQKVNDIADHYRLLPRWVESHQAEELSNHAIMRELSSELAFPYRSFFKEDQQKQEQADLGGQLEPSTMQHTPDKDHIDDNHFEVDRHLETVQSAYSSPRSAVPNPDGLQGWLYKDDWVFPFVGAPDMSNDAEINRFKKYVEISDAASLHHEIISQQSRLKNCSFIDRMNRYKISRRLSFIIKHVRGNPALHYLLLIHKANRLEDACFGLEQLRFFLNNQNSIEINGEKIALNEHRISEITQVARRLIEQRTDYQAEKRKYPDATVGGQLLSQSSLLTKLNIVLQKNNSSYRSVASPKTSIDPLTNVLTQKINSIRSIEDQIAALTNLQIKITTDPVTDFHTYTQEVEQAITLLKNSGKWTVETAELIFKGFVEGAAEHIVHTVKHPIDFAQHFVKANIDLLKLIADIMPPMSDEFSMEPERLKWYENELNRKSALVAQMYQNLCETIPQISREEWGRIAGQLFADWGMLKGAGAGLKLAKNATEAAVLKEHSLYAKIQQRLEQALLKNPEMVTTEGVIIKGDHEVKTEQSLLQTMSNSTEKVKKNISEKEAVTEVKSNTLGYGRTNIHRKQLKETLRFEEITSVTGVTKHGLERLMDRGFEPSEIISILTNPTFIKIQNNGGQAFIEKIGEKFQVIIVNDSKEVITGIKDLTLKKVIKLGKNYGWEL